MEIFNRTLSQMLMLFTFILVGIALKKSKILSKSADSSIAKLATYVFVPALSFYNLLTNCTVENFLENYDLIFYGFGFVAVSILASYPLSRLLSGKSSGDSKLEYKRNIYKYALAFGNYGFVGNFLILGIYGDEMLYKFQMFSLFITVFCYSWGLSALIPKTEKDRGGMVSILKGLINPSMIALTSGIICGLLGVERYLPDFLTSFLVNSSGCMGPIGMILAGVVIGGYDLKKLLNIKSVYIATFLRLIVIPSVFAVILKFIGVGEEVIFLMIMAFAAPVGLNTIIFPASYGGETKIGAAMAMISNVAAVITIPTIYYLFVVLI